MDDGGRCLLDVISDPSALEYFLESGNELTSDTYSSVDSHLVTNAQLRKTEFVSFIAPQQIVSCGSVVQNSNAITYTTFQQPVACFQTSGQAVSNHAPVPSSSPSPFQTPAPSPTTPSPIFCTSKSPMPPPSQSPSSMSSHRSPAQVPIHSVHCASPSGYPATQSPSATQNIYQVRSPASSPLPSSFATVQLNKVQTTTSMAPATINILQHQQPPTTLPSSTSVTPASAVLSSTALQQLPNGQIMQIIQATPPNSTVRHQPSTMKHIQPKPQQILPKPAGGASQATFGKSMAMAQRTAVNLSPSQGNSLVLGQGQTVLPSSNVTVGPQGTLLLNHISLGVGQNPILIPGGAGLPPSVQLLVRPQPPCATTTSQPAGSMTQTPNMNNAAPFLAALHVQNQPTQQAFLGQPKTLTGQGQTMVIPGQSLGAAQQPQLSNAGLRPNIISSARMVGQTQAPLVLQQIQGPITVIQALQGHNVGVGNAGITLANHGTSAGISQLSGMIPGQAFQSAVAPSLPQSIVLNSQHITTTAPAVQTLINSLNDQTASGQLAQASQLQVQQASSLIAQPASQLPPPGVQQQTGIIAQQQQQPPKPQSVNLEELLKQAGIVPEDSPPTPPPSTTSQVTVSVEPQPISAYNQMTAVVTPQCLPTVNGPQTVVVSQEHIPGQNAQSQLVAHLHQPIMSSQLQTSAPIQAQVKLSLAQDGSVIIQRPVFPAQGPALTISQSQQVDGSQQVTIPMVNFTTATTTPTSNMAAISVSAQPVQSVLLQRLNSAPNVQPQTPVSQAQVPSQPQQQLTTSPTTNTATSVIPLAIQGINVNLVHSFNATPSSTVVPSAGMVPATSVYSQPVVTMSTVSSSANTILSSMLSQTHPMLAHTLAQDSQMMPESSSNGSKQSVGNVISNGTKIVNQSPLLVQSLQTLGGQNLSPLTHLPVSSASTSVVSSSTTVTAMSSSTVTTTLSTTTTTNCNASLDSLVNSSVLQSAPLAIAEPSQVTHATAVSNSSLTIPASLSSTVLTPNVTLKSPAPSLIVAGYPFSGLQPGQKVQTIQLTTQGQEAFNKIQGQLQSLMGHKSLTQKNVQQIRQLQSEQQKILAQGKVIAIQSQPVTQLLPLQAQQQTLQVQHNQHQRFVQHKQQIGVQTVVHDTSQASPIAGSSQLTSSVTGLATTSSMLTTLMPASQMQPSYQMSSLPNAQVLTSSAASITTTASTASPGNLKVGGQIITLTPQQVSHHYRAAKPLSPEQQQQILYQNQAKQALFLKLQQQHQQQQQQQQQQQEQQQSQSTITQDISVAVTPVQTLNFNSGILQIQTITPGAKHLRPVCPQSQLADQLNRGVKRPASTPVSRSSRIQQQLTDDQNGVVKPDYKRPFTSKEDVCKRLLKYHVYNIRTPTVDDLNRADDLFETVSKQLLEKAKNMLNKYRYLLLKEAKMETKTCEKVMLDRMFMQEENAALERDRQIVKEGKFLDLPSPPEHWLKLKPEVLEPPDSPSESKFDNLENCSSSNKDLDFEAKKDVKIKLEPLNTDSAYDDVSDDNSPLPADCRVAPDNLVVTKEEKSRNYDEWAEIQKELEMYPLESDETSEGNLGYEPSDDNTALADFEPPVPKVAKNVDSSLEAHTSLLHSDGMTSHVHSRPSVSHHLNLKSDPLGIGDDNAWNAALDVQMENNIDTVSACIQTTGDSEEQMTNLMIRHGRASEEDANDGDLGLADIDGLDGQYDHMDEGTLSRSMPRTSHVSECDDECGPCDVTSLFDTTFKSTSSGVDLSDMRNGSFDRSQDDDLNAQVQSAINSILNLQRIDDSCDAFVMSGVSHDELKGLQVCVSGSSCVEGGEGVDPGREKSPHFAFDMMKQEEEEDEECVSTSRVEEDEDLDEDDGEDDEGEEDDAVGCMEYEASSVAAEMGSFGNDGPSEIDVALDEAVKSILL